MADDDDSTERDNHQQLVREAAGMLAVGLADEIARPLEALRDLLGEAVQTLDDHVATAKGPDPLSYDDSKMIRETIADAYLKSSTATRVSADFAAALSGPGALESCDVSKLLDDTINLVRHRFSSTTELFIDHGKLPSVVAPASELVLALARILLHCADSTRLGGECAVSIRTRTVGDPPHAAVMITIAENGSGADAVELVSVTGLARSLAGRLGGALSEASSRDAGSTFELRIPVAK